MLKGSEKWLSTGQNKLNGVKTDARGLQTVNNVYLETIFCKTFDNWYLEVSHYRLSHDLNQRNGILMDNKGYLEMNELKIDSSAYSQANLEKEEAVPRRKQQPSSKY